MTDSDAKTPETAVENRDISVSGGSLPVEHERIFAQTTELLGVNVSPPSVIVVKSPAEIRADTGGVSNPGEGSPTRSFAGVMGIGQGDAGNADGEADGDGTDGDTGEDSDGDTGEGSDEGISVAAYVPSAYSVVVNDRMTDSGRERVLERTLAHEFVHNVQFRQGAFERLQRELGLRESYSRDRYLTYVSIVEGTAVYVADTYDRRYLTGSSATLTSTERYRLSSSGVKYAIARYYFGSRYVAHRYDDAPASVSSIYDDPPQTTEQLLHNDADGTEEPLRLSVRVRPGENRTLGRTNTNGELFTRIALGTELNESRAASAAAGWGADELVPVVPQNRTQNRSFVWATRWDSPAEAAEFETALDEFLASRTNSPVTNGGTTGTVSVRRDGSISFRAVRVSTEVVVLVAGDETFVRNASISGTNASVHVSTA